MCLIYKGNCSAAVRSAPTVLVAEGKALGIHPTIAIIALIAGTELVGFWGALVGAPLAGLVQATVVAGWREYRAGSIEAVEEAISSAPALV